MRLQSHRLSNIVEPIGQSRTRDREEHVHAKVPKTTLSGATHIHMDVAGFDDVYCGSFFVVARHLASYAWDATCLPQHTRCEGTSRSAPRRKDGSALDDTTLYRYDKTQKWILFEDRIATRAHRWLPNNVDRCFAMLQRMQQTADGVSDLANHKTVMSKSQRRGCESQLQQLNHDDRLTFDDILSGQDRNMLSHDDLGELSNHGDGLHERTDVLTCVGCVRLIQRTHRTCHGARPICR